jgi:hypothetical protein
MALYPLTNGMKDQAKTAGLPGTIALARKRAEMATEKTAAAALFEAKSVMVHFPFF